ncbi:DUF4157 domain-containing protein, partial [Streptomyces stramineus]
DPLEQEADRLGAAFGREAPGTAGAGEPGPLDASSRRVGERLLGADFRGVRVHVDPAAARAAGAAAFTLGEHIVMGEAGASPGLLGHELAHVAQQQVLGPRLQRGEDPPPQASFPTAAQVLTEDGKSFRPEYQKLQEAYHHYFKTSSAPAPPERWFRLARGSNRKLLLTVLGPNLGKEIEPKSPGEADVLRLGELQRPASYDPEDFARDVDFLSRYPEELEERLSRIPEEQLAGGEVSIGYLRIAVGNVGEILARPVMEAKLRMWQQQGHPRAKLFLGVRAKRVVGSAGGKPQHGASELFRDGMIGELIGSGLQVWEVFEVKAGKRGGQEGTEQIHRQIEKYLEDGHVTVLRDGRSFTYAPEGVGRTVTGLASAHHTIITARGVSQLGGGGAMGVGASVERIDMPWTPEQLRYLAAFTLQSLAVRAELHKLKDGTRTVYELKSTADFITPDRVRKILTEHNGLAATSERLYRLTETNGQLLVSEQPVVSLAFVFPKGTAPVPPPPQLLPGPAPAGLLGPAQPSEPAPAPQLAPAPQPAPAQGPPSLPPPSALPRLRSAAELQRGSVPFAGGGVPYITGLGTSEFLVIDEIVRDAQGRPVTGYQDGEIWIRIIRPGGEPLPEIDPATGSPAPVRRILTPEGPALAQMTPYEQPPAVALRPAARAFAGALGVITVANELLAPFGAALTAQQKRIEQVQRQIRFYIEFGADPRWEMRDEKTGQRVPWSEPETGLVFGHKEPHIVSIDIEALRRHLPSLIPDIQSLVLFLETARQLNTIDHVGARYFMREHDITDTVEQIRATTLRGVDEQMRKQAAEKGGNIFRLRSKDVTIYRYSGKVPVVRSGEMFDANSWVREVGPSYRSRLWGYDRVKVEPANAAAAQAARNAVYQLQEDIDTVYREVVAANRRVLQREPEKKESERVERFVADEFTPSDEKSTPLGITRYMRDPKNPEMFTVALGELRQFWVERSDLEPVSAEAVAAYARGPAVAPPPSSYFQRPVLPPE